MVGATLGPYRLGAELGAGGMGKVFLATVGEGGPDLAPGTRVAVKVVHPHLHETPGFLQRFQREADVGRAIVHANVVRTFDAGAVDGHRFLVMEYVEGQTLRGLLDELGRVPEELCRHIGREVARGLAAIHAAAVVHRDLKPENVLITADHVVKVMDLGVAKQFDATAKLSQTGAFVGSLHYAAPEQFRGGDIDGRADLYALGMTLYELATGTHPIAAEEVAAVVRAVLHDVPRRAGELNPQLSPFFEETLARLLAKSRDERFASSSELSDVLDRGERSTWWRSRAIEVRAATQRPLRRIRIPRETALYGRDEELARLRALVDGVERGEGRVVLVEGEAGIGKSRLVDEFASLLHREGRDFHFVSGGYPPGGAATASGAFSTAYREQFGDAGSAAYLHESPVLVAAFDALLRGEPAPAGAEPLTKDSLQTCFARATQALAKERLTIVLIDDLHFAPEEGRALFASLALGVAGHRALLVGTARRGLPESWTAQVARLPHATRMPLARLGAKDLVQLLADSLGSERLAEELSGKIAAKSDGNPYFVFEILRGLRDGRYLARNSDGTWGTTRVIRDIEIPGSVKDLVEAQLAGLTDDDIELLRVAACCGYEFDPLLAGAALGVPPLPLLKRLGAIELRHRLVRSAGARYVFDHHQVHEVLYAGLSDLHRRSYHAAIADALEAREGAAAREPSSLDGEMCVDLAGQFLQGGQGARALRYLGPALAHLARGWLNEAAVDLADHALAVPGLLAGRQRCELLLQSASRLDLLGRRDPQRAALDEARALADAFGDTRLRSEALRELGVLYCRLCRFDDAQPALREALDLARAAGNRTLEARAAGEMGAACWGVGRLDEAQGHLERSLALCREVGDRRREAAATGNLGLVHLNRGRLAEAHQAFQRCLALAAETGDRRWEALTLGNLGIVLQALGRYAEAREHIELYLASSRQIGDRRSEAIATGNLGSACQSVGRLGEAREWFARSLAFSLETGDRRIETRATGNLGIVLSTLGRAAEAEAQLERCLALAQEIGDRRAHGFALHAVADLATERGNEPEAARRYAEALTVRQEIGHRDGEADTLRARGVLLARQGRTAEARADLAASLAIARELSLPNLEILAAAWLALLPGGDAAAALATVAAREELAEMQPAMEARFVLWRATGDPAHLAEAKRRLDSMVAQAPPDCRSSMLGEVTLHREIEAAAREAAM